jgi:signal transduction histidine kinase
LLAEEKKIAFKIEVAAEGNFSLVCDRLLVSQVLANLILNAFKFTPSGGTVSLSLSEEGNDLVVKVRDTGQGIPASQLECVFEKFWKAKARMGEGAGLGLFISKAIVNAHRGNISVESEPEKGSCFTIRFPKGQVSSEMGNHQVSLGRVLQSA